LEANIVGILHKMQVSLPPTGTIPEYYLVLDHKPQILLNTIIGKVVSLEFSGVIKCIYCQRKTKNSYSQGYCYVCAQKLARCDLCIVNPKNCRYHLGTCREPEWGEEHCFTSHIVYLANSSGIKVGIARKSNLPTRWIDQGAIQGLAIISTKSRYQAGLIEAVLAKKISDKTAWRKMLAFDVKPIDLIAASFQLLNDCRREIQEIKDQFSNDSIEILANLSSKDVVSIQYPIDPKFYEELQQSNSKVNVTSLNISKIIQSSKIISDQLLAIKGQYLIFSKGVINIRNLTGYEIIFNYPLGC